MYITLVAAAALLAQAAAPPQDPAQVRKLFEAGQYQKVVEAAQAEGAPQTVLFDAAQSQLKLGAPDAARALFDRLASGPENDPWTLIGISSRHLLDGQLDEALATARRAIGEPAEPGAEPGPGSQLPEAHFQLGLVLSKRQEWPAAAAAFGRATELNPMLAYAYYYGGLAHYREGRPDQMIIHFEQFLKLAPNAPERPEVLSILRTVRRR
jgi:tetratricopeptide (TPR) repeat protein